MDEIPQPIYKLLIQLSNDLIIIDEGNISDEISFVLPLAGNMSATLNWTDYRKDYLELISTLLSDSRIGDKWSSEGIKDHINQLIHEIALRKMNGFNNSDDYFEYLLRKLFQQFLIEFPNIEYFIPIRGLVTNDVIEFGDVKIWPISTIMDFWNGKKDYGFLKELNVIRDSIASSRISAEQSKAGIILQRRVEKVLNIIRYFAAIVYWDRPTQHTYLEGTNPSRIIKVIHWDNEGHCGYNRSAIHNPIPIEIDNSFIQISKRSGFEYIKNAYSNETKLPIHDLIVNSISWYGDATQDFNPLSSFMKYYTAMESLLKEENKDARDVVPTRAIYVLGKNYSTKIKSMRQQFVDIIDERNSVFHSGRPKNETPEYLDYLMHNVTRNIIQSYTYLSEINNWKSKMDFLQWIENNHLASKNVVHKLGKKRI